MRRIGQAIRRTPLLAGLPREVAVLTAVAFCVALGFGILAPSLPIFARTFDVSALQASAVISVFALMRFVSAPGDYPWNARCAYFTDPDDNVWEIYAWYPDGPKHDFDSSEAPAGQ